MYIVFIIYAIDQTTPIFKNLYKKEENGHTYLVIESIFDPVFELFNRMIELGVGERLWCQ